MLPAVECALMFIFLGPRLASGAVDTVSLAEILAIVFVVYCIYGWIMLYASDALAKRSMKRAYAEAVKYAITKISVLILFEAQRLATINALQIALTVAFAYSMITIWGFPIGALLNKGSPKLAGNAVSGILSIAVGYLMYGNYLAMGLTYQIMASYFLVVAGSVTLVLLVFGVILENAGKRAKPQQHIATPGH